MHMSGYILLLRHFPLERLFIVSSPLFGATDTVGVTLLVGVTSLLCESCNTPPTLPSATPKCPSQKGISGLGGRLGRIGYSTFPKIRVLHASISCSRRS